MTFEGQATETQTKIQHSEVIILTDQSHSADETLAQLELRANDLLLGTAVNPGSSLLPSVAERFVDEAGSALDTGELILPGYDRRTALEQQEALAIGILDKARGIVETPAIASLHEQVSGLQDQLAATQQLVNPDVVALVAENEELKKELERMHTRSDARIKSLQDRIGDIATIAADKKIDSGRYRRLRTLRAKGTIALRAIGVDAIS